MKPIEGIVIIDSTSGIPLFSKLNGIDDALFSGFLSAIKTFSKELNLGGLNSFTTEEKHIHLVARNKILTALISPSEEDATKLLSIGLEIGNKFEEKYDDVIEQSNDVTTFYDFENDVETILQKHEVPFIVEVAEFVKKEYGGNIAIQSTVQTVSGQRNVIDIIADRGEKKSQEIRDRIVKRTMKGFSEDVVFCKVIDGVGGKNEVLEFINSMRDYGNRGGKSDTGEFPYFPSKSVIIAKDFSPTLLEELNNFSTKNDKAFIGPTHLLGGASDRAASPIAVKCFIEVWKWPQKEIYPDLFFS